MKIGMLWYDNSKDSLETKVRRAVDYYRNKYNVVGNLAIYMNPTTIQPLEVAGVSLYSSRSILSNHFWVGQEDKEGK